MGKIIKVTPEELGVVADKIANLSDSYTQIYRQLFVNVDGMGDAWQGEDNIEYINQIKGFLEELKMMADRFGSVANALRVQKDNYVNRQETNKAQVKKLNN
jgi:WXG100 family type VII secretion target